MADNTLIPPVTGNAPISNRRPGQKPKRDREDADTQRKSKRLRHDKGKGKRIDEFA